MSACNPASSNPADFVIADRAEVRTAKSDWDVVVKAIEEGAAKARRRNAFFVKYMIFIF